MTVYCELTIKTRNVSGAGTIDSILIKLHFGTGKTLGFFPDNTGRDMSQGSLDVYQIDDDTVVTINGGAPEKLTQERFSTICEGVLDEITLSHPGSGSDQWNPEWIMFKEFTDGTVWGCSYSDQDWVQWHGEVYKKTTFMGANDDYKTPWDEELAQYKKLAELSPVETFSQVTNKLRALAGVDLSLFLKAILEAGLPAPYVITEGRTTSGSAIIAATWESGTAYRVDREHNTVHAMGPYDTLSGGLETAAGGVIGVTWGAWWEEDISGGAASCALSAAKGVGILAAASWFNPKMVEIEGWSLPSGVQFTILTGFETDLGASAGVYLGYTWL